MMMDSPTFPKSYATGSNTIELGDGEPMIGAVTSIGNATIHNPETPWMPSPLSGLKPTLPLQHVGDSPNFITPSALLAPTSVSSVTVFPQQQQQGAEWQLTPARMAVSGNVARTSVKPGLTNPVFLRGASSGGYYARGAAVSNPRRSTSSSASSSTEVPLSTSPLNGGGESNSTPRGAPLIPLPDFTLQPLAGARQMNPGAGIIGGRFLVSEQEGQRTIETSQLHLPLNVLHRSEPSFSSAPLPAYPVISPQEAGDRIVRRIALARGLNKPAKSADLSDPVPIMLPSHAFDPIPTQAEGLAAAQGRSRSPRGGLFSYAPPAAAVSHTIRPISCDKNSAPSGRQENPNVKKLISVTQRGAAAAAGGDNIHPPGTGATAIHNDDDDLLSLADLDRKLSIAYSAQLPFYKTKKHSTKITRQVRNRDQKASRRRHSDDDKSRVDGGGGGGGWFGAWGMRRSTGGPSRASHEATKRRHSVPSKKQHRSSRDRTSRHDRDDRGRRRGSLLADDSTIYDDDWTVASSAEESFYGRHDHRHLRKQQQHLAQRRTPDPGSTKYLPPTDLLGGGTFGRVMRPGIPMHPILPPGPIGPSMMADTMEISPVASRSMLTCSSEFRKQYPYVYQALCKGILDIQKLIAHEIVIPIKEDVALKRSAIRSRKAVTVAICDQLWRSFQGRFPDPSVAPKLIKKIADYFYDKIEFGIQDAEDERSFLQWFFRFEVENAVDLRQNITIVAGKNTAICNLEGSGRLKRRKGDFFNVVSPDTVLLNIECVIKALFLNGGHLTEINMDSIFVDRVASGQNLFARNFIGY